MENTCALITKTRSRHWIADSETRARCVVCMYGDTHVGYSVYGQLREVGNSEESFTKFGLL